MAGNGKDLLLGKLTLNIADVEKKVERVNQLLSSLGAKNIGSSGNLGGSFTNVNKQLDATIHKASEVSAAYSRMMAILQQIGKLQVRLASSNNSLQKSSIQRDIEALQAEYTLQEKIIKRAGEKAVNQTKQAALMKQAAKNAQDYLKAVEKVAAAEEKQNKANLNDLEKQKAKQKTEYVNALKEQLKIQKELATLEERLKRTASPADKESTESNILIQTERLAQVQERINKLKSEGASASAEEMRFAKDLEIHKNKLISQTEQHNKSLKVQTALWDKIVQSVVHMATSAVWNAMRNGFSDAVEYTKEFYDLLNQVRIVSGATEEQADAIGRKYIQMAQDMSVGSRDIASAAVEFYRQGLGEAETEDRLKWTTVYAKIAGLEFQDAAELVTAATNSMDLDVQRVVDVFSYLGDASASG